MRLRRSWLLAALAAGFVLAGASPAVAQSPLCKPPQCAQEKFVVPWLDTPIDVLLLLPRRFATSSRRYPVVYLFHCGGCGPENNLDGLNLPRFLATRPRDQQAIVVMPHMGWGIPGDYRDGSQLWESFFTRELIPRIEAKYAPSTTRSQRAVMGWSIGGLGALRYAARHPDLFVAAGSFSGIVDITRRDVESPAISFAFLLARCGGAPSCPPSASGVYGDPILDAVWWHNANPPDLAPNVDGLTVYNASGNGVPCDANDAEILVTRPQNLTFLEGWIHDMNVGFDEALTAAKVPHRTHLRPCGIHWPHPHTERDLAEFWPLMSHSFGRSVPRSFRYRRVDPRFSVWGWSFKADPGRAAEFLDIRDASRKGLTLSGSGTESVTTAKLFHPEQVVLLSGATETRARADRRGRLRFNVSLGPAHRMQQFTVQARLAGEGRAGYFMTRRVVFRPIEPGQPAKHRKHRHRGDGQGDDD